MRALSPSWRSKRWAIRAWGKADSYCLSSSPLSYRLSQSCWPTLNEWRQAKHRAYSWLSEQAESHIGGCWVAGQAKDKLALRANPKPSWATWFKWNAPKLFLNAKLGESRPYMVVLAN